MKLLLNIHMSSSYGSRGHEFALNRSHFPYGDLTVRYNFLCGDCNPTRGPTPLRADSHRTDTHRSFPGCFIYQTASTRCAVDLFLFHGDLSQMIELSYGGGNLCAPAQNDGIYLEIFYALSKHKPRNNADRDWSKDRSPLR